MSPQPTPKGILRVVKGRTPSSFFQIYLYLLMLSFDDILTNRVKLGRGQFEQFLIMSMIDFIDGYQEIMMAILIAILTLQWNLSHTEVMFFGSSSFFGIMIGSFISSVVADRIGRRTVMAYGMFSTGVVIILQSVVVNYGEMILLRVLLGILFGISLPLSMVVVSEIVPTDVRGKFIVMLQFMFSIGMLYMIGCAAIFFTDLEHGDWRALMLVNSGPPFLCFLLCIFVLKESPRYLIQKGRFELGFTEINALIAKNGQEQLTSEDRQSLLLWSQLHDTSENKYTWIDLFNDENRIQTISMLAVFTLFNLQGVGLFVLVPLLLANENTGFGPMALAYSVEIPAILIVVALVDHKMIGRRKLIFVGFTIMALMDFILYAVEKPAIVPCLIIMRFGIRMVWSGIHTLPSELYSTPFRSLGAGFVEGVGKAIGCVSPFIMFSLYYQSHYLPFLAAGVCCIIAAASLFLHPKEMTQVPLDINETTVTNKSNLEMSMQTANEIQPSSFKTDHV